MKKAVIGIMAAVGFVTLVCAWDQVNTSVDKLVVRGMDAIGGFSIDGSNVVATAGQLNAAASGTVTNGTLNPSIVSNMTMVIVASNLTLNGTASITGKTTLGTVVPTLVSNMTSRVVTSNLTVNGTAGITGVTTVGTILPTLVSNMTATVVASNATFNGVVSGLRVTPGNGFSTNVLIVTGANTSTFYYVSGILTNVADVP